MIPYNGTCEQTKKIRRVTAVHSNFWLKGTCTAKSEPRLTNTSHQVPCGLAKKPLEVGEGMAELDLKTELKGQVRDPDSLSKLG